MPGSLILRQQGPPQLVRPSRRDGRRWPGRQESEGASITGGLTEAQSQTRQLRVFLSRDRNLPRRRIDQAGICEDRPPEVKAEDRWWWTGEGGLGDEEEEKVGGGREMGPLPDRHAAVPSQLHILSSYSRQGRRWPPCRRRRRG